MFFFLVIFFLWLCFGDLFLFKFLFGGSKKTNNELNMSNFLGGKKSGGTLPKKKSGEPIFDC